MNFLVERERTEELRRKMNTCGGQMYNVRCKYLRTYSLQVISTYVIVRYSTAIRREYRYHRVPAIRAVLLPVTGSTTVRGNSGRFARVLGTVLQYCSTTVVVRGAATFCSQLQYYHTFSGVVSSELMRRKGS